MTIREKRDTLYKYCGRTPCCDCVLCIDDDSCIQIATAHESELDIALTKIGYGNTPTETENTPTETTDTPIKDSGERREFNTGAVRDMSEGKGDMVSIPWEAILRLSKHYENGAKKYERWNFRKGIPLSSFIDSACRHLAKYQCGCDDEDHLSAAAFNVLGAMLMENTKPEMIDLPLREGKKTFNYFEEKEK